MFQDRDDAAVQLAQRLLVYQDSNPLILAIPRGAVSMGRIIAETLQGDLDVVLVRKLGAPGNPELAIGAIDETGWVYLIPEADRIVGNPQYVDIEKSKQLDILRARRKQYTPVRPPLNPEGRTVIVVDDGLATGSTMIAALHALRARHPEQLICAVPVAPPGALSKVGQYADQVVCLQSPILFYAVGQFYQEFRQVSDEKVVALLTQ